jgi:hypothetical protein
MFSKATNDPFKEKQQEGDDLNLFGNKGWLKSAAKMLNRSLQQISIRK